VGGDSSGEPEIAPFVKNCSGILTFVAAILISLAKPDAIVRRAVGVCDARIASCGAIWLRLPAAPERRGD
jgi:hypothetical protein